MAKIERDRASYIRIPNMPKNSGSTKHTIHLACPKTSSGKPDARYTMPQFVKADGTRDKRCTPTRDRM